MLLGWLLAAVFFLGAAAVWVMQIVDWLKDGTWTAMTPVTYFGGAPELGWVGADQLLSVLYDVNLGLIAVALAVISAELGLFLESRVAQAIGDGLKEALRWPYVVGVSVVVTALIAFAVAFGFQYFTEMALAELPLAALVIAFAVVVAFFVYILRRPLGERVR